MDTAKANLFTGRADLMNEQPVSFPNWKEVLAAMLTKPRQRYHSWNFANGEILAMRLQLIACAVGFGGPLIAGSKGCDQQPRSILRRRSAGAVNVDSAVGGILLVGPFRGLKTLDPVINH